MMRQIQKRQPYNIHRRGITLIEVVVTTGIIATSVAVIIPAVGSLREGSQLITCKDKMRQLGEAHLGYAADHQMRFTGRATLQNNQPGWFPWMWTHILNHEYFGDLEQPRYSWFTANQGTIRWLLDGYGPLTKNQIWCPSYLNGIAQSSRAYPMNRYAADWFNYGEPVYGKQLIFESQNHPDYREYFLGARISDFSDPSQTYLHIEGAGASDIAFYSAPAQLFLAPAHDLGFPGAANNTGSRDYRYWHFRHSLRMNILHADTHVSTINFARDGINTPENFLPAGAR